jgi:hypothetical protein
MVNIKQRNTASDSPAFSVPKLNEGRGFSKREYAAILLCVPQSETEWLDNMIIEALKIRSSR